MYVNGSEEFNKAIDDTVNTALHHRLVFTDDNSVIESISKLNGYISSNNTSELQIGTTNMSYVEVEAYTDKILTGREFRLESGVKLEDGTYEYAPIGYFTVQKPDGDVDVQAFKAFDRMQKLERPYSSSLTEPTTTDKILVEICGICRVTLATPIPTPIEVAKIPQGYTCREVLGYIAGLHAKFACFDRFGELNLRWYSETPIEKKIGVIWSFTKAQEDFTVEKIEIAKDGETKYTSGSGFKTVFHSNPLATQEITNSIMATLNGFTYNASSIEMLDDIRLDPWDVIKITYLDGNTYLVPCMAITQNFSDGSTVIEAYAKSDTENEYRFTGPTIQYLNRMAMELLVANRVIATKVDAEYVQTHAITTDNLDAITANITNLVVDKIDGKYATIDFANIDVAHINKTNIGLLFAEVGLLDRATIVDGHITGFLDAVEINANKITAGTLVADRILLSGEEGSVLFALNNLGELTSTNVDTLDGYILTDRTITADKIIAKSITTNELDVAQIFADTTVTDTLFAQDITATGTITGATLIGVNAEISSGKIGGFDIKQTFLGYLEETEYLDINTNEDKMSYWYSFLIRPKSYMGNIDTETKVFWIGAHPDIVGSGIDDDGFYSEDSLVYPLYITANGKIVSNGELNTIIFGSGHNYTLNPANWNWRDSSSAAFGDIKTELTAGYLKLNDVIKFSGSGFDYYDTNILAFNIDGIYSPKINAENLSVKEQISTTKLIATDITAGPDGVYSNGNVTVLGDIKTVKALNATANLDIAGDSTIKGQLIAGQGMYVHDTGELEYSSTGYVVLARMEVIYPYHGGGELEFDIQYLTGSGTVKFKFNNPFSPQDTRVQSCTATYPLPPMYYVLTVGTSSVTIELIAYKSTYQDFRILGIRTTNKIQETMNITYPKTFESTLRGGAVQATMETDYFGNVFANGDVIAGYGTANQASLLNLSQQFKVLKEANTFTIVKMDNIIRLVGQIVTTETTNTWVWVLSFTDIASEYKPPVKRYIMMPNNSGQTASFELNPHGYIQTTQSLPAGNYYFDVAWIV